MTTRGKPAPRNYFGVPQAAVDRSVAPVYHDRLDTAERVTGALELEIETLSPVHAGCGSFELTGDRIGKEPARRGGALVLPGSSIKGACRQTFEALTASGSPFDPAEHHRRAGGPGGSLSAAAALFGTLGLQGRISFDDAVAGGGQPAAVEPEPIRLSVAYPPRKPVGRRFYGPMPEGADQPPSVPASSIPAHTRLQTFLRFRNLTRQELGLMLLSLGVDRFTPRLGGGKYDDFGWVRFRLAAFRLRPPGLAGGGAWERAPETVAAFVAECQGQVSLTAAGQAALDLLARKLQFPGAGSPGRRRS